MLLQTVLQRHGEALGQASRSILKKETLTGDELKEFLKQHPPTESAEDEVRLHCVHSFHAKLGLPCSPLGVLYRAVAHCYHAMSITSCCERVS